MANEKGCCRMNTIQSLTKPAKLREGDCKQLHSLPRACGLPRLPVRLASSSRCLCPDVARFVSKHPGQDSIHR